MKKQLAFSFFFFLSCSVSCCDLAGMLRTSSHEDWKKTACLDQMARYVKNRRLTNQQRIVIANASNKSVEQAQNLLRSGRVRQARLLSEKWRRIQTGVPRRLVRMDERGNILPPSPETETRPKNNSRADFAAALEEEHERQRPENQPALPGLSYSDAQTLFFGQKREPAEMRLPLEKLARAAAAGADLEPFIRMLAEQGSADPASPKYISSQFLQASFMYYAESLPASSKDKLTAYMQKRYDWRVRYAAALAAAAYSDRSLEESGSYRMNDPAGKFFLNDEERSAICGLFAYAWSQNPQAQAVLNYRFARVYDRGGDVLFYAETDGPENPFSLLAYAPAAVTAVSASEASALAVSAPAVIAVGGLWIICNELEDAFSASCRRNFTHSLEGALPDIPSFGAQEEIPAGAGEEEYRLPLIETAASVRGQVGALTDVASAEETAQTCIYDPATRAKPEKWKLKDLSTRLNDPSGENAARFYDCLAHAGYCPKSKKPFFSYCRIDRLDTHIRKNMSPVCQVEFDQIDKVMKDIHHFYDPSRKRVLKVRAVWWGGRWKTEAELPLRISGPIDWVRMFGSEFEHLPQWAEGLSRGLRFGDHEMDTATDWKGVRYHHFHYMELLPYKGGQQFICNHMLFASYDEMSQYFGTF